MSVPAPTRRQVLVVGGAVAIVSATGCTTSAAAPRTTPTPSPTGPDPLLAVIATEQQLIARYDATLRRFPALARLSTLRSDHAAHLTALRRAVGAETSAAPSAGPSVAVPGGEPAALAALVAAERAALASTGKVCLAAGPADRAVLLGSIAACERSHLVALA